MFDPLGQVNPRTSTTTAATAKPSSLPTNTEHHPDLYPLSHSSARYTHLVLACEPNLCHAQVLTTQMRVCRHGTRTKWTGEGGEISSRTATQTARTSTDEAHCQRTESHTPKHTRAYVRTHTAIHKPDVHEESRWTQHTRAHTPIYHHCSLHVVRHHMTLYHEGLGHRLEDHHHGEEGLHLGRVWGFL